MIAPSDEEKTRHEIIREFAADRWLAHQVLFRDRHPDPSAPAHKDLVEHIYCRDARVLIEGFRGFAKSTTLEEAAVLMACLGEFHNMLVVGSSYRRAVERLASIKRELEINRRLLELFPSMKGASWTEGKIVLSNQACIQALGRDQSMLGIKHLDWRPDAALVDDVEDPDEVRTDVEREQTWDWFLKTFLPSLDHPLTSWVRVLGTRRGKGSLPERLEDYGWRCVKYPIEYIDEAGERQATWPGKFPLPVIDRMKADYRGDMTTYMQEFMCRATSAQHRVFTREMMKTEPRSPSWHAVYAMIDPARSTNRKSASTGWAVWSWIANRLIVWAAGAEMLLPDEIVELCFTIAEGFDPVWIGVEKDGLEEFLMQPLRQEQAKRGIVLPVRGVRAPRDKLGFIRGLQPYYNAGEVIHAGESPELVEQLLGFPYGRIDAPNALAYALTMRPQDPIYKNFAAEHIAPELTAAATCPVYLAGNASAGFTTAALCQYASGQIRVLADWVVEGPPSEVVADIQAEALLAADTTRLVEVRPDRFDLKAALRLPEQRMEWRRFPIVWAVPPEHGERWTNLGLIQAIGRIPAGVSRGAMSKNGQAEIIRALSQSVRGEAAILVSERAAWTLRALAGGYTRALRAGGGLTAEAEEGPYRTLMEGIEAWAGLMNASVEESEDDGGGTFAYNRSGQRYKSALPERRAR
jgi:hypothetical protein